MPFAIAMFLVISGTAHAQTFTAELAKVDKLRRVFGDQLVNSLTALPPDQYKAARDRALAAADKAGDNAFARDEARDELCATYAKAGVACHEHVDMQPEPEISQNDGGDPSSVAQAEPSQSEPSMAGDAAPAAAADSVAAADPVQQPSAETEQVSAVHKAAPRSDEENDAEAAALLAEDPSVRASAPEAEPRLAAGSAVAAASGSGQAETDPDEQAADRGASRALEPGHREASNEPAVIDDDEKTDPELDQAANAAPQRHVSSIRRLQPIEEPREHYADQPAPGEKADPRDPTL